MVPLASFENLVSPAGWWVLAGSAALVLAGLGLGYPTLTGLGLAGLLAVAFALLLTRIAPRTVVERAIVPDRVTVGEPALARLRVTNSGRLPAAAFDAVQRLSTDAGPRLDPDAVVARVGPLLPQQRRTVHVPVPTPRRGLVRVGPVRVERRDPLGLIRRAQPLCGPASLWVRPRVIALPALPLGVVPDFEGRAAERAAKGSSAFSSMREYASGDDPRHIHWPTSARLGTMMVRDHVDTTEPRTAIVLDTRSSTLDADRLEDAVTFAASVAVCSARSGQAVTLAAVGEDALAVRREGGHHILDRLAAVGPSPAAPPRSVVRLAEQARPGGCLVVVAGDEPGLLTQLIAQRRRFTRVVLVLLRAEEHAGEPASIVSRRTGLAVIRADSAREAARAWTRLVTGAPA